MNTILVQMKDKNWTRQALHLACALAKNYRARIILLRLEAVQHLSYLGTEFGSEPLSRQEYAAWLDYASIAADYGVEIVRRSMQCWSVPDAIAEAADYVDAQVVFAYVPQSRLPYVQRLQHWRLKRRLQKAKRHLYTFEQSVGYSNPPWIVIPPAQIPQRVKSR